MPSTPHVRYVFTYYTAGMTKGYFTHTYFEEDTALGRIWTLLMQGWTLHPYNQNGNNEWIEWILTQDPLISAVGPAYRIVKVR